MRFISVTVLVLVSVSISDTASQTDWSAGGGVMGPVTDWGISFYCSECVDVSPSSLKLIIDILPIPEKHELVSDYKTECVEVADIDGDGDNDILRASFENPTSVAWWENTDGTGTSWCMHALEGTQNASSAYPADFDLDGDTDILSNGLNATTWW